MTYTDINNAITKATTVASEWADKFLYNESIGSSNGCGPLQLVVLTNWIRILTEYRDGNFNSDGSDINDPEYTCLSLDEILSLVGRVNDLEC